MLLYPSIVQHPKNNKVFRVILLFPLCYTLTDGVYFNSPLQNMRGPCKLLQGVRAKNQGICSQAMLGAAKLRRSSHCRTPQHVKTAHPGHNTSLTLSDCRRYWSILCSCISQGGKNWRKDTTHCVGLDQQQAQGVYEHRGIRHHC